MIREELSTYTSQIFKKDNIVKLAIDKDLASKMRDGRNNNEAEKLHL